LFVPLPLAVMSVLLFAAPNLTTNGKIAYAAVLYICYGMLLTCLEVPYNAILPMMSKNDMEKNDIISLSTFIASIMIGIVCDTGILGGVYAMNRFDPIKDIPNGVYLTGFYSNYPTQEIVDQMFHFFQEKKITPVKGKVFSFENIKDAVTA
jgi:hypothetical protein